MAQPARAPLSLTLAVCAASCGGDGGPAFAGLGLQGDTCAVTADCDEGLACRSNACRRPDWSPEDGEGERPCPEGTRSVEGVCQADRGDGTGGDASPGDEVRAPYVRFVEIGEQSGVRKDPSHGSAGVLDWDDDGRLDLFVSAPDVGFSLFRNKGDGTFEDVAAEAGLNRLNMLGGFGVLIADYDNDGDQDVYVTLNGFGPPAPNALLRNDGGVFTDVAAQVGVAGLARTIGAVWLDHDGDGWLDLYVVNGIKDGARNNLYRNTGDGGFVDVTEAAGVGDDGRGFQAVAGDYDGDLDTDLYVVNRKGPNVLYANNGDGTFRDLTAALDVAHPHDSIGALFVDYDGDDDLDLFVAPENEWQAVQAWESGRIIDSASVPALYRNDGGSFTDIAEEAGLTAVYAGRSVIECDCDGDGLGEIIVGAGSPGPGPAMWNYAYRYDGRGSFIDEAVAAGVGPTAMTHGMTIADLDGDGFEDIYLIPGHSVSVDVPHGNALYRNLGHDNGWIKVRLEGTRSTRDAIGARVLLTVGGRRQVREVRGGQPFAGTRDRTLVFGLGPALAADRLEVRWPSGAVSVRTDDLDAFSSIELVEGP